MSGPVSLADQTSSSAPELAALTFLTASCTELDLAIILPHKAAHIMHILEQTPGSYLSRATM